MSRTLRALIAGVLLFSASTSHAQEPPDPPQRSDSAEESVRLFPAMDRGRIEREISEFEKERDRYSQVKAPVIVMLSGGGVALAGLGTSLLGFLEAYSSSYSRSEEVPSASSRSVLLPIGLASLAAGSAAFTVGAVWLGNRSRKRRRAEEEIEHRRRLLRDTGRMTLVPSMTLAGGSLALCLSFSVRP